MPHYLGKLTRLLREANLIIDRTFAEPDNVRSVELKDWWRRYRRDEQEQER